jgi:hypothetical protein
MHSFRLISAKEKRKVAIWPVIGIRQAKISIGFCSMPAVPTTKQSWPLLLLFLWLIGIVGLQNHGHEILAGWIAYVSFFVFFITLLLWWLRAVFGNK